MHSKPESTPTRTQRLAAFFRAHPNQWHDGADEIAAIGGRYAWRSRVAEARQQFGLDIRNRQRRIRRPDGSHFVISEYALIAPDSVAPHG